MRPHVLKSIALAIAAAATTLESQQILPPGTAAAIGTLMTFVVGLIHPSPSK